MSDKTISTGSPVADNFIRKKVSDDITAWALVSYLESKGLLNRDEFWDILNTESKLMVHAILKAEEGAHSEDEKE